MADFECFSSVIIESTECYTPQGSHYNCWIRYFLLSMYCKQWIKESKIIDLHAYKFMGIKGPTTTPKQWTLSHGKSRDGEEFRSQD